MLSNIKSKIVYQGQTYYGAQEIGFNERGNFHFIMYVNPPPDPRGTFCTSIPIADLSYREEHNSAACVADNGNHIVLWDDWKMKHRIKATRKVLKALLAECYDQGLPLVKE